MFNVPDEVTTCLRHLPETAINPDINPFLVSGDFDGDGFTDFAVQVKKKNLRGIVFCFASGRTAVWGFGEPSITKEWPFDSWVLFRKGSKHIRDYPQIRHDALGLIIADEGGGLVYWNGKELRWKPEE
jgi:hypothetical protein